MLTPHYVESYVRPPTQACPHAVRIELDEPGASYQAGDIISGSVIVIPAFDEGFSALTIELQRYAHGRVTSVGLIAEQRLFAGPWRTGAKGVFPFRLEAPRAAARYHGHLLHLELRLAAILPRSDAPLLARPLESARAYPVAVHPITVNDPRPVVVSIDTTRARDAEQRGFKVFLALTFLLVGLVAIGVGVVMALGIIPLPNLFIALGPLGGGMMFSALGAIGLYFQLGRWLLQRKVGIPEAVVQTNQGANIDVSVRLMPDLLVTAVRATIRAYEHTSTSVGESTSTEEHVVADRALDLVRWSEPGLFYAQLPMSALAAMPPAGGLPSACIAWQLLLCVELPSGAKWEDTIPLDAYPGGEPPAFRTSHFVMLVR